MRRAATGRRSSPPATAQAVRFFIDPAIFRRLPSARYAISAGCLIRLSGQPPEFSAVPVGEMAPAIFDRTRAE